MSNESKKKEAYILNVLRLGTLTWEGRNKVFENARKQVQEGFTKDGKPILKYYWKCAVCHEWSREKSNFEIDHIQEVGPLVNGDWTSLIERLYPDIDKMQCLCVSCHAKKSATYNASRRHQRKVKFTEDL